jgi:AI-2 transport protein TqsA
MLAWLQLHQVPSWLAVVLTMVCAYALILALAGALVFSAARLATLLPEYQPQFASLVDQATEWLGEAGVTQEQINSVIGQFDLGSLVGVLQRVLSGATSVVSDLAFILVLLFFLIIDSSSFPRRLAAAGGQRPRLVEAMASFAGATRQYVVVSTVFGLIVALVDVAALYWLDVSLPWLWGCCRSSPTPSPTSASCSAWSRRPCWPCSRAGSGRRCW